MSGTSIIAQIFVPLNSGLPQALESWKTWKITKKVTCMEKSWNLKKPELSWKMEFCEIITKPPVARKLVV